MAGIRALDMGDCAQALEAAAQAEESVPSAAQPTTPPSPGAHSAASTPCAQEANADDAAELCALLQVEEAVRDRTVGEGAAKLLSLVDVARLVSGKTASNAGRDAEAVLTVFS